MGYNTRTIVNCEVVEMDSDRFNFGSLCRYSDPDSISFEKKCQDICSMITSHFRVIESLDPSDLPRRKCELANSCGCLGKAIFNSVRISDIIGYEPISSKINFSEVMKELTNVYRRHFIDLSFIESFVEVAKNRLSPYLKEEFRTDDGIKSLIMVDAEFYYLGAVYEDEIAMWWSRLLNIRLLDKDIYIDPDIMDENLYKQICYLEDFFKRNKKRLPIYFEGNIN